MSHDTALRARRLRLAGGLLSLAVGTIVMALKFYAHSLTGSTALLSDAIESIVNVAAAAFALWAIRAAESPPDPEHPYGHGKIEFVTAVFEGGLISFASLVIAYEALRALLLGAPPPNLEQGLWVVIVAGVLNGLLGVTVLAIGRSTRSIALEADGRHVLSDCLTTIGILLGLGVAKWTGLAWIDPLIALCAAGLLAYTGVPLMRRAIDGLIDTADPALLRQLLQALERSREPGLIRLHHVRAMRNGRSIHVDGHIVLPEFWSIERAHETLQRYEEAVLRDGALEGEIELHADPCRQLYCRSCDLTLCPVREHAFESRPPLSLAELTSPVDITDRG